MNLKKTAISLAAAVGLMASIALPSALAEDTVTDTSTMSASVNEGGSFTFNFWAAAISFNPATVTTDESATVTQDGANHRVLQVFDYYSTSPGWDLQMSATNLTSGDYFIDKKNLSVRRQGGSSHLCLGTYQNWPVEGGNTFQTITLNPALSSFTPLTADVSLVSATTGRGCGWFQSNYQWQLNVPAGTHTSGTSVVYQGSIVISNVLAPSGD